MFAGDSDVRLAIAVGDDRTVPPWESPGRLQQIVRLRWVPPRPQILTTGEAVV
jgi:hypothetical protein